MGLERLQQKSRSFSWVRRAKSGLLASNDSALHGYGHRIPSSGTVTLSK